VARYREAGQTRGRLTLKTDRACATN
jgi:hypothetical protein